MLVLLLVLNQLEICVDNGASSLTFHSERRTQILPDGGLPLPTNPTMLVNLISSMKARRLLHQRLISQPSQLRSKHQRRLLNQSQRLLSQRMKKKKKRNHNLNQSTLLETCQRQPLDLDEWKRQYSNNDTRSAALPWFWEHYKPDEYSLWRVDYKYNEELTAVFMTSNLIGGFFNRLEASRKYIFGAASVYGESNASVVTGAFVIRGDDALPAFDVAPDFESYNFTKLDPSKEEDKDFIGDQWAWDKPLLVEGKV